MGRRWGIGWSEGGCDRGGLAGRGGGSQRYNRHDLDGDIIIKQIFTDPPAFEFLQGNLSLIRRDQEPEKSFVLDTGREPRTGNVPIFVADIQYFWCVFLPGTGSHIDVGRFS